MIHPTRRIAHFFYTALFVLIAASHLNPSYAASLGTEFTIEPDDYAHLLLLDTISPHVTLSTGAFSDNRPTFSVVAFNEPADASTGTNVFAHAGGIPFWNTGRTFRMDFNSHVTAINLDYIASGFLSNMYSGRLEAYSSDGALLDSYLTAPLAEDQFETMTVTAPRIAYALAYPPADPFGDLDHLRFTVVPEPATALLLGAALVGAYAVLPHRRVAGGREGTAAQPWSTSPQRHYAKRRFAFRPPQSRLKT